MNALALALVLSSAVLHATWNFFAKRAHGGAPFVWLYDTVALILYAPIMAAVFIFGHLVLTPHILVFLIGSGLLHLGYFLFLQRGYRVGDLSVVYPLARGTGPLLTTIAAIAFLQERPSIFALMGTTFIIGGVFIIASGTSSRREKRRQQGVLYGVLTGIFIAGYTLLDKEAVSVVAINPLLQYYGATCLRVILLAPYAARHWRVVRCHWSNDRLATFIISTLSPLSYYMVLIALVFTPVSSIAPAREVGVLFGTLMGTRLLAEGQTRRRLLAAGMVVIGIIALAV